MEDFRNKIICGENEAVLPTIATDSVDTIITDPPYGWSFMGKRWDYEVPSIEQFRQILRVLKPGGTMLCFAGSRTQHRMACNVEDAGFILKDCIQHFFEPDVLAFFECLNKDQQQAFLSLYGGPEMFWLYGSGFPKAKDISKALDKQTGAEREVVGKSKNKPDICNETDGHYTVGGTKAEAVDITAPATAEGILWDGWKSHGLKPAYEPILVAMKANDGSYANNALTHDVAGLNIDDSRIAFKSEADKAAAFFGRGTDILGGNYVGATHSTGETNIPPDDKGRYPANVILDEAAAAMLDEQSGESVSTGGSGKASQKTASGGIYGEFQEGYIPSNLGGLGDTGGASRFFYCAKASKSERNDGCEELAERDVFKGNHADNPVCQACGGSKYNRGSGLCECDIPAWKVNDKPTRNHHPTVKPLALMEYLCKLTSTPTGGIVLDPFAGSGTTCLAAYNTGRDYIGIEKDPEYVKIIEARLAGARAKLGLFES